MDFSSYVPIAQTISPFIMVVAAVSAAISAYSSKRAIDSVYEQLSISVYNQFQSKFKEIQKEFPSEVNALTWAPEDMSKYKRHIQMYWYLVLDEWIVCNVVNKRLKSSLWDRFYRNGVKSAMRRYAFISVLIENVEQEQSFLGHGMAFISELDAIQAELYGEMKKAGQDCDALPERLGQVYARAAKRFS